MNYSELRTKTEQHFRATLQEAKRRRDATGPFSDEEKGNLRQAIELRSMSNEDYWHLLGHDNATAEFKKFCGAIDIPLEHEPKTVWMVLDEIRKAQLATFKAIREHGQTLEAYDFTEPPDAALDAPYLHRQLAPADSPPQPSEGSSGPLLSELFSARKAEAQQAGEWSPKLLDDYQSWTDLFIELKGDRPILDYRKSDARDFKSALIVRRHIKWDIRAV